MNNVLLICALGLVVTTLGCSSGKVGSAAGEKEGKVGAYVSVSVDQKDIVDAARFAVSAQAERSKAKLTLIRVVSAEKQVVSGTNLKLRLKVDVDGTKKNAEAVVWSQPWRKPEPNKLTAWSWK